MIRPQGCSSDAFLGIYIWVVELMKVRFSIRLISVLKNGSQESS